MDENANSRRNDPASNKRPRRGSPWQRRRHLGESDPSSSEDSGFTELGICGGVNRGCVVSGNVSGASDIPYDFNNSLNSLPSLTQNNDVATSSISLQRRRRFSGARWHLFLGAVSIGVQIVVVIVNPVSFVPRVGAGIWAGVIFFATGVAAWNSASGGICVGPNVWRWLLLTLSVISCLAAVGGVVVCAALDLYITKTNCDRTRDLFEEFYDFLADDDDDDDDFGTIPWKPCAHHVMPIVLVFNVVLIVVSVVETAIAVWTATDACRAISGGGGGGDRIIYANPERPDSVDGGVENSRELRHEPNVVDAISPSAPLWSETTATVEAALQPTEPPQLQAPPPFDDHENELPPPYSEQDPLRNLFV